MLGRGIANRPAQRRRVRIGHVWVSRLSPEKLRLPNNGLVSASQEDSFTIRPPLCVCVTQVLC